MSMLSTTQKPDGFDAFWAGIDAELAGFPVAAEAKLNPRRSNEFSTSYDVKLTSIGPYRIFAYLSIPHGDCEIVG